MGLMQQGHEFHIIQPLKTQKLLVLVASFKRLANWRQWKGKWENSGLPRSCCRAPEV